MTRSKANLEKPARAARGALLIVALVALLGQDLSGSDEVAPEAAEALLAEGDRRADERDFDGALLAYKRAYESILPRLRGLEFKEPVAAKFVTQAELADHLQLLLREEISPEEMLLVDATLEAFGFAPRGFDTEATLLALLGQEIAGLYDSRRKQMLLIRETSNPERKPGFIEQLLGVSREFEKYEARTVLAHEMAHALADQHFDLEKLTAETKGDSDRMLALTALVEGEATVVMFAEMTRRPNDDGRGYLAVPPSAMESYSKLMESSASFASGPAFRTAPRILQTSLLFGYTQGAVFLLHLTNRDQWASVDRAFRAPPISTEQILHPEKFYLEIDDPQRIELPAIADLLGGGWKEVGRDTLGELQIAVLLERHWGPLAAAGWDGDGFAVFEHPAGGLGLAWVSTWDSEADAREFSGAYARWVGTRIERGDSRPAAPDEPAPPAVGDRFRLERAGVIYHLSRRGAEVTVIEGFSEPETDALAARLLDVTKHPKTVRRSP